MWPAMLATHMTATFERATGLDQANNYRGLESKWGQRGTATVVVHYRFPLLPGIFRIQDLPVHIDLKTKCEVVHFICYTFEKYK